MMEDLEALRREQLERHNGRFRTYWHYSRWTVMVALWTVLTLVVLLQAARAESLQAKADARAVYIAAYPMVNCWVQRRSTTFLIAGGSQQEVYDGLTAAEHQLLDLRSAYLIVRANTPKETP